ncbi:uncharacterized protein TNCV_4859641 [Trichonephila clavipes]|nr:uncharacterized protein TNCV_4859641 [Trichonephila clavipes]
MFSYTRAFYDRPRYFERWSSDENDTRAVTLSPNYYVPPTGKSTRGLLATDHVILNHGQVTWTTPELAPPLLTTTPHQREDVSALDRFNVHRCPTRRVFSGTGLELMTYLPWSDTLTTGLPQPSRIEVSDFDCCAGAPEFESGKRESSSPKGFRAASDPPRSILLSN